MSKFQESIEEGYVKKIPLDRIKAKSLLKSAEQAIYSAKKSILKQELSNQ